MKHPIRQIVGIIILAGLSACATSTLQRAPVVDRTLVSKPLVTKTTKPAVEKDWRPEAYTVKKGDTLHSIGLEFGFDYKDIAQWNNIQPPYVIQIGRQIKLKEPKISPLVKESVEPVATALKTEPVTAGKPLDVNTPKPEPIISTKTSDEVTLLTEPKALKEAYSEQAMKAAPVLPKPILKPIESPIEPTQTEAVKTEVATEKSTVTDDDAVDWSWPSNGKVLTGFNDAANAKGLDISGTQGQAVLAAGPGKVVYSGSGLRGYGKLVIIKHNKTYLSAYAHNSQILVKEGQEIIKGQKIAEMGSSDTDHVKLHFEIRKLGKPVDPAKYLPANPAT